MNPDTCDDCGGAPRWRWRSHEQPNYCERCMRKSGNVVSVIVDIDALAALVGDAETTSILQAVEFFDDDEGPKDGGPT